MTDSRALEAVAVLRTHCRGTVIQKVLVHGINSLKTVNPPLSAVGGVVLDDASAQSEAIVEIRAGSFTLSIDLQRTGRMTLQSQGRVWSPGEPSMPTVQLVLDGGLVASFVEPAKTKRIMLAVSTRS